ncbi:MAG: carboxypeptidase-like regulatory domain-containing protein, partial [Planctomycetes bacterium]|nr:carboxypeptidase-like regulatory domain-containing protein [Planctomycetota bacterium]
MAKRHIVLIGLFYLLVSGGQVLGQDRAKTGSIKGQVIDADTKTPIIGASVLIVGTTTGTATDTEGNFSISEVPVGNYSLQ